jgi:pimeloyl-ACP methyl ester carboxylesterase
MDGAGLRMVAVLLVPAAVVAGCSQGGGRGAGAGFPTNAPTSSTTAMAPPTSSTLLPGPPVVPMSWSPCQDGLQCASVSAPLDYAEPQGPQIQIAVARRPAADPAQRIGSIVINPGGPGGTGIDDLANELRVLTGGLLARFDIVSFDPRGVDRSQPVTCGEQSGPPPATPATPATPAPQGLLPDPVPSTAAAQQAVWANDKAYAAQCATATGLVLPFVGTVDAARDLDRIRAALGDAQLTYIGHSYGTLLGLTYADLFPTHVRAMVLDSVIDPSISRYQMVVGQAIGFEGMLRAFFSWCSSSAACAWRPVGDPTAAFLALVDRARSSPLPAGPGRQAGPGEIYTALLSALYNSSQWQRLGAGLARAEVGDGSTLAAMTQTYNTENGPNSADAAAAITCLDYPVPRDQAAYPGLAASAAQQAPVFGPMLVWGVADCATWPALPTRTPHAVRAPGAPPILVVGTTGDVATPYQWAVSVAGQLLHGVLVTWQGQNHVAYYYSPCVRSIDEGYLVAGTVPAHGTVCRD